jgi:hypothetical protein
MWHSARADSFLELPPDPNAKRPIRPHNGCYVLDHTIPGLPLDSPPRT